MCAVLLVFFTANSRAEDVHASKINSVRAHVVFQMSDDDVKKWNLVLNNAKNVQQDLGAANVDIEIVAFGPGINMLKFDSVVNARVDEALTAGVKIFGCENTLNSLKLSKSDMMTRIGFVPAGVVELIKKQGEGYAYIRP